MKYIKKFESEDNTENAKIGDLVKFTVDKTYFGGKLNINSLNNLWKITKIDYWLLNSETVYQLTDLKSTGYYKALRHEFKLIPDYEIDAEKYNL